MHTVHSFWKYWFYTILGETPFMLCMPTPPPLALPSPLALQPPWLHIRTWWNFQTHCIENGFLVLKTMGVKIPIKTLMLYKEYLETSQKYVF